jgi:hypothetical protein
MFWTGDKSDEKNKNDLVSENSETYDSDSDELFKSIIESNNSNSAVEEVALNSDEEVTSEEDEETSSDEEEYEDRSELDQLKEQIELLKQQKLEFFSDTRKVFLEEWLYANGNWLSELSIDHLDFLRDILGITNNSTSWPSYNR